MDCPTLEILGRALDLDPEDPEHLRVMAHVRLCADCRRQADLLGQVEAALSLPTAWGAREPAGCLHARDSLEVLHHEPSARDEHLAGCPMCAAELDAIRGVEAELEELPQAPAALRSRLRRLATLSEDTTIEEPRAVRRRSSRTASGARRTSARHSSRRRSGSRRITRRMAPTARYPSTSSVGQPTWAWGVLAAAAVLLVALALVLSPTPSSNVAKRPDEAPPSGHRPRVSDVQGRTPKRADRSSAPAPNAVDPEYPLPHVTLPPRKVTDDQPVEPLPPEDDAPDATAPTPSPRSTPRTQPRPKPSPSAGSGVTQEQPAVSLAARRPPIRDDGGRLQLALAHLNAPLMLQAGSQGAWKRLGRQRGEHALKPGDRIKAGRGGLLSLDDGAFELALGRDTEVVIRAAKHGPVLDLVRGRVLCEVASLEASRRFVVGTDQADFSVLGTVFAVSAGDRASALRVVEGTVKARNAHGATKVPAGRGLDVDGRRPPGASAPFKASELAWAKPFLPQRKLLFAATFDQKQLKGFQGALTGEHDPRGGLALVMPKNANQQHWGYAARIPAARFSSFRPDPDVYVQFSVWTDKPADVLVQCYNDSQKREFMKPFGHPGGYWRTFTVCSMDLSTYFDPGRNPVKLGDLFTNLEVFAGKPKTERRFLVDDVFVYRRVYR